MKIPKEKTYSQLTKELDKMFSLYIKKKSKGVCFKCGLVKKNAGVSHYFGRKYRGTRWSEENCDWACWGDHFYHLEKYKQKGEFYYNYMLKKLGQAEFDMLEIKAHTVTKLSRIDLIILIEDLRQTLAIMSKI